MAETLLRFPRPIAAPDGSLYEAHACGSPLSGNTWQGWIEFVPLDQGDPVRTPRETTQPNRADTEYWATGLTDVYLEGALRRAMDPPLAPPPSTPPQSALFDGPAPSAVPPSPSRGPASVLNPFSVYEKGEALLRRQLGALSAWHLVNILEEYELTHLDRSTLSRTPVRQLVELVVQGVVDRQTHA